MAKIKISRTPKGGKSIQGIGKRPQKGPKKPTPQARRDSSSSLSSPVDFSGDGGYSGVDDVSDSEDDDEEHVFAAEEEHIISNDRHHALDVLPSSPRPPQWSMFTDTQEDDEAADADDDESDDDSSASQRCMQSFSSDVDFEDAADESSNDSESWNGLSLEEDEPTAPADISSREHFAIPVERRVRFAGLPDSESESDETEDDHNDWFPDLFISQQSLDPTFRREIEQDDDEDDNSSASFSYWDHNGAAEAEESSDFNIPVEGGDWDDLDPGTGLETINFHGLGSVNDYIETTDPLRTSSQSGRPVAGFGDPAASQDEEESDSDDYDGDTTDDEQPPLISQRKAVSAQGAMSEKPLGAEPGAGSKVDVAKPITGRLPIRTGKKPICVLNPNTRKMMIFTPQKKRQLDPHKLDYFSMMGGLAQSSPSNSPWPADFWQTGTSVDLFTAAPLMLGNDASWSPSLALQGSPSEDSSYMGDGEDDPDEKSLDIDAFIDFNGDSEAEAQGGQTADEENASGVETPSRRPSIAPSADGIFVGQSSSLDLDRWTNTKPGSVGAFRLNQTNLKLLANGEASEDSLAFKMPYTNGTLRGIKQGALGGAATPLTPERRHKKKSVQSPLETAGLKRKAFGTSAEQSLAHKRQRSISDVRKMHI